MLCPSSHPVFQSQSGNPLKFAGVVGHQRGALGQRMAGNPEVIGTNGYTRCLQRRKLLGLVLADGWVVRVKHDNLLTKPLQALNHALPPAAALGTHEQLGITDK